MIEDEISHREPEFTELLQGVRKKITRLVKGNEAFTTIMFTGSGTSALDATISSLPQNSYLAILNNGVYAERLQKIVQRYNFNFQEINFTGYPDLEKIEDTLQNSKMTHFLCVHHETCEGLLNPLNQVGTLCKKYNKILIVDAISSIAVQDIDVCRDNISFLIGSSNKGIGGAEGLSFIVVKKSELEKSQGQGRSFYLDLYSNYRKQKSGQTLFTPGVRIFSGLNEALHELNDETLEKRIERFSEIAKTLRVGIQKLGFEILTDLRHASNTVTWIGLGNRSYQELYNKLKEQGFVIYSGKDGNSARLCTFGNLHKKDIESFLKTLEEIK